MARGYSDNSSNRMSRTSHSRDSTESFVAVSQMWMPLLQVAWRPVLRSHLHLPEHRYILQPSAGGWGSARVIPFLALCSNGWRDRLVSDPDQMGRKASLPQAVLSHRWSPCDIPECYRPLIARLKEEMVQLPETSSPRGRLVWTQTFWKRSKWSHRWPLALPTSHTSKATVIAWSHC